MYSQIANTTFSYILTLSKFRNAMPEEHRPSWIKVTTITMVSKFLDDIDIQKLRNRLSELGDINIKPSGSTSSGFTWKLKQTKFYNQVTLGYTDSYSTKSIKVFPNGSIQVAGCSDLFDCNRVIKQLTFLLKRVLNIKKEIPTDSFRVVMINSNFSLNYNINLIALYNHFLNQPIFNVTFDPDRYSAVKIKFKPASDMKQVTVSIFGTGKIIITGAETFKEIAFSYNMINQHILTSETKIKVSRTEEIESFDTILGYSFDTMIPKLEKMGFKPWDYVKENKQINF
jgi:TATA-box binding protein (TBP) (component of TFIID and TFIIIB)